jgi:hypothetical protein
VPLFTVSKIAFTVSTPSITVSSKAIQNFEKTGVIPIYIKKVLILVL